eukprot:scaffold2517_cov18-Tisochrysis_lutea.AAC.2
MLLDAMYGPRRGNVLLLDCMPPLVYTFVHPVALMAPMSLPHAYSRCTPCAAEYKEECITELVVVYEMKPSLMCSRQSTPAGLIGVSLWKVASKEQAALLAA